MTDGPDARLMYRMSIGVGTFCMLAAIVSAYKAHYVPGIIFPTLATVAVLNARYWRRDMAAIEDGGRE